MADLRGGSTKLFVNLPIQFYKNNVTNLQQLTLQSTTSCPTHRDHIPTITD